MALMAMTLRLDDELDAELTALAKAEHLSKQQVAGRALREYLDRNRRTARTLSNAERVIGENARLIQRLGE